MAGRGPAPKDPAKRARTNANPVPVRVIRVEPSEQPELPEVTVVVDGEPVAWVWPERTRLAEHSSDDTFAERNEFVILTGRRCGA